MKDSKIVILHLSDIHFHQPHGARDIDHYVRNELEVELRKYRRSIGKINVILVTGDIAYSARESEYKKAALWLDKICKIGGCEKSNVILVPGNHDVNRLVADKPHIKAMHQALRATRRLEDAEAMVESVYRDASARRFLYSSLEAYNKFAAQYRCNLSPRKPVVEKSFSIDADVKIGIWGMNSCLFSDRSDEEGNLYLDERQFQIPSRHKTHFISLCHHPLSWLKFSDKSKSWLDAKANIQLFGHLHQASETVSEGKILKIYAGAVHPERNEGVWSPSFNLLVLKKSKKKDGLYLRIQQYKMIWGTGQTFSREPSSDNVVYELKLRAEKHKKGKPKVRRSVVRRGGAMGIDEGKEFLSDVEVVGKGVIVPRRINQLFMRLPRLSKKKFFGELNLLPKEKLATASWQDFADVLSSPLEATVSERLTKMVEAKSKQLGL